jgi:hypothetical protein
MAKIDFQGFIVPFYVSTFVCLFWNLVFGDYIRFLYFPNTRRSCLREAAIGWSKSGGRSYRRIGRWQRGDEGTEEEEECAASRPRE